MCLCFKVNMSANIIYQSIIVENKRFYCEILDEMTWFNFIAPV